DRPRRLPDRREAVASPRTPELVRERLEPAQLARPPGVLNSADPLGDLADEQAHQLRHLRVVVVLAEQPRSAGVGHRGPPTRSSTNPNARFRPRGRRDGHPGLSRAPALTPALGGCRNTDAGAAPIGWSAPGVRCANDPMGIRTPVSRMRT